MNAQGHRTRRGRPYTSRSIQDTVTYPFYSGRLAYRGGTPDEQIIDGKHPAFVAPDAFDRMRAARAERDLGPGQKTPAAPCRTTRWHDSPSAGAAARRSTR